MSWGGVPYGKGGKAILHEVSAMRDKISSGVNRAIWKVTTSVWEEVQWEAGGHVAVVGRCIREPVRQLVWDAVSAPVRKRVGYRE
jgi:hypothetical protein